MSRFVIEGTWLGYRANQDRVVHRSVHHDAEGRLRKWADSHRSIGYSDGTRLVLSVRDCKPRERVETNLSYMKLIYDCVDYNVTTVDDLHAAQKARRGTA